MTPELKPCPFCGGTNIDQGIVFNTNGNLAVMRCPDCNAHGPWASPRQAPVKWNTRCSVDIITKLERELTATKALLAARVAASEKLNAKAREQDAYIGKQERELSNLRADHARLNRQLTEYRKEVCCTHEWYLGQCAHCGIQHGRSRL